MNAHVNFPSQYGSLSRREFIAASISTVGGIALFNLPNIAYAETAKTLYDSLGNTLNISKPITNVVPMGIYAQTMMETLYPEALASLAKDVSSDLADFKEAGLASIAALPATGTFKGNFGKTISVKEIDALKPDLVLNVGFNSGLKELELAQIETEVNSQIMYLDISYGNLSKAYRTLGQALGCSERANLLADYIEDTQRRAIESAQLNSKVSRVFYGPRVNGKKVTRGVYAQIDVLKSLGCEPIITPYNFDIKTVDFEILLNENPEFILFDDTNLPSMFFAADNDVYEEWKNIPAINEGRFAVAPALMHSILGSAIFAQSIGMLWMAVVLSHQESDIDIVAEMQLFYEIFYGLERDESSIGNLLGIVKGD